MREINKICVISGAHRSGTTWIGNTIARGTNSAYIWEPFNVKVPYSKRSSYGKSFLKINKSEKVFTIIGIYIFLFTKKIPELCKVIDI